MSFPHSLFATTRTKKAARWNILFFVVIFMQLDENFQHQHQVWPKCQWGASPWPASLQFQNSNPSPIPPMPSSILWPVWSRSEFSEYSSDLQDKIWKKLTILIFMLKANEFSYQ